MPVGRIPLTYDIESRTAPPVGTFNASTAKDSRLMNALIEGEDIVKRPGFIEMSIDDFITVTIASPAVVTYTAHGLVAGREVTFSTTGALPTGITANTTYYVTTVPTVDTFQFSATLGGSAVNTSGTQSGVHRLIGQGQGIFSWNNYIISCAGNVIKKMIGLVSSAVGSIVGTQSPISYCLLSNTPGGTATVTISAKTLTMTIAAPAVVTETAHGKSPGDIVIFQTTGALPTGVTAGVSYYVIATGLTVDNYQFSATSGGTGITTSGSQSGTHSRAAGSGVVTYTAHNLQSGQAIVFTTTGTLPAEIITGTTYYVVAPITANTFNVSATPGGAIITTTTASTATTTATTPVGSLAFHNGANIYTIDQTTFQLNSSDSGNKVLSATITERGGRYGSVRTATMTIASPCVVTLTAHGFAANQTFTFSTTGALPTGVSAATTYYVISTGLTANEFQFSATSGGAAINSSGSQSGVHSVTDTVVVTFTGGSPSTPAAGTAVLVSNRVDSITITDKGDGYTSTPIISITAPPAGVTATFSCTLSPVKFGTQANTFIITNAGSSYFTAPTVVFTVSNGQTFTKTTTINSSGQVTSINNDIVGIYATVTLSSVVGTPATTTTALATANMNATISGPYAPGMAYLDGYVYVLKSSNARIYGSSLEGPKNWNALNYLSANSDPDSGVGIVKHLNYLMAFGKWSVEFFYNAGLPSPGSPLSVNKGAKLEIGCANGFSIAKAEHTVIWVGRSLTTGKSVYMLQGLSPVKISTRYIDKYLNADPVLSPFSTRSYCFKVSGHSLYVLTLDNSKITFVYDMDEKKWYFWTSQTGDTTGFDGTESYFQPTSFTGNNEYDPGVYLQDDHNGKIYSMSSDYYNDAGNKIYFRAVSPILDSGSSKRKFYKSVEVIGDKVSGNAYIRRSDDDYVTWSNRRTVVLSDTRPILRQYGSARRRAWEVFSSDNIPIRLKALEMEFGVGEMGQGAEG